MIFTDGYLFSFIYFIGLDADEDDDDVYDDEKNVHCFIFFHVTATKNPVAIQVRPGCFSADGIYQR
jgi:hypothetical protein